MNTETRSLMSDTAFVPARNIDEVIEKLRAIVDWAKENKSPFGIFPSLYLVVTIKVKEAIEKGDVFEDNARMDRLDTIFANRYLEAFHQHQNGERPTLAWQQAFRAAEDFSSYLIIQELMIGMNAHINLDLGIAAAEVAPGNELPKLKKDFMAINEILGSLVAEMREDIEDFSPAFWIVDRIIGDDTEDAIAKFSMNRARDEAWKFAKQCAPLVGKPALDDLIAEKDKAVVEFGKILLSPGRLINFFIWIAKLFETKNVVKVMDELMDVDD